MNILVVYETYSGGTLAAAQFISSLLSQKGHSVTIRKANETELLEFNNYDFVILGTPSWLERKEEGQPHENFIQFMERCKDTSITPVKCAVFGLGDETYAHFARGADRVAAFLKEKGCDIVSPPFKVDSYYVNQGKHEQAVTEWITSLGLA